MRRVAAVAALILAACSSPHATQPGEPQAAITPATADQVKGCKYLDDVAGTSAHYGVFAGRGITNAREEAIARAASLGATHIVWAPPSTMHGGTSVNGQAFRCQ